MPYDIEEVRGAAKLIGRRLISTDYFVHVAVSYLVARGTVQIKFISDTQFWEVQCPTWSNKIDDWATPVGLDRTLPGALAKTILEMHADKEVANGTTN